MNETPEPQPEPDTEPDEDEDGDEEGEPEALATSRCEAETTVGGVLYRCALDTEHAGEHAFQPTEDDAGEPALPDQVEAGKALAKLQKHVHKRVGEILGAAAEQLVACELCTPFETPGWRPNLIPPDAIVQDVLAALGYGQVGALKADTASRACETCDGWGQVASGSKVVGQESLPCVGCSGMGWVAVGNERASRLGTYQNGPAAAAPVEVVGGPDDGAERPPDPPEVQALRELGYTIFAPMR